MHDVVALKDYFKNKNEFATQFHALYCVFVFISDFIKPYRG